MSAQGIFTARLMRTNLAGQNLAYTRLTRANLERADLTCANLSDADLVGANLEGANLTRTNLNRADLTGANLSDAKLHTTMLIQANLSDANLSRAKLNNTSFREANLTRANLTDANLDSANFSGANLTDAIGLPWAPKIPHLDQAILTALKSRGKLNMGSWHGLCGTSHCRAGWVVVLAGKEGAALEKQYGTNVAASLIYNASCLGPIPNWYATNEEALADLKACAAADALYQRFSRKRAGERDTR